MARVALVLSGGGAKGAFAVGVLLELLPHLKALGRSPSIFAATSTGSFIAPLALTDRLDQLALFYTSLSTAQVLALRTPGQLFSYPALADPGPIRNIVAQNLSDEIWQDIVTAGGQGVTFMVSAVTLQTGELFLFHAGAPIPPFADKVIDGVPAWRYAELGTADHLRGAVLASGMEPTRLDPVRITYEPVAPNAARMRVRAIGGDIPRPWRPPFTAQFVDGGVRALAPVEAAVALGADEVFLVANQPSRKERLKPEFRDTGGVKTYTSTPDVLLRTVDLFQLRVGDADQAAGEALTGDSLDFRPAVMANRLLLGRQIGRAFVQTYVPPPDAGGGPIA
jgi:predicted acylesterase/phospholipase RssA